MDESTQKFLDDLVQKLSEAKIYYEKIAKQVKEVMKKENVTKVILKDGSYWLLVENPSYIKWLNRKDEKLAG